MSETIHATRSLGLPSEGSIPFVEHSENQVCCLESCIDDDMYDVSTFLDMDLLLKELDMDNLISNMSRIPPQMLSPALRSPLGACSSRSAGSGRRNSSRNDGSIHHAMIEQALSAFE